MDVTIKRLQGGDWRVRHEGKVADRLTYDEMLGLVASITMPEKRQCLQWLKTPEQIKEWNKKYKKP